MLWGAAVLQAVDGEAPMMSEGFVAAFEHQHQALPDRPPAASRVISAVTALEQYCEATAAGTRPGIQIGIPALDRATNGLQPGELWLDQGRTDSLKTMAYCNRLLSLAHRYPDRAWLVANMEMPPLQMVERLARMRLGQTQRELEAEVKGAGPNLTDLAGTLAGLYFLDDGAVTLSAIETEAAALAAAVAPRQLSGIIIDHAGLVRAERTSGTGSYERASATAIGLKQLARRLNLVVFAVVQANRGGKAEEGAPVALESARDSGAYEENADFVLAYSSIVEGKNGALPWIKCRLAKNRRGPRQAVALTFDPRTLRMHEMVEEARGAA